MNVFKVEVIDPTREVYNVKTFYSKKEATDFIRFNSTPESFGHIEKERTKKERFALGFPTHSGRTTTAETNEYYIGTKKVSYEEAMANIRKLNEIAEKTKMNPTMRNIRRNPENLSNKELVHILEALTLNVVCSSNLFLGIENAKLKKKFNALYEEYTNTIKFYPNEDRQWTIDPDLNEKLSLLHKNLLMILNKTYDNLTSYYSEEGLDDSDSAGAATARFLSCNIDPLRMTMAYPPKTKINPSHEEHRDTMRKLYEMARASARGTLDIRLLDIAHGAVRMDELDHVLEQCDDRKVCDYAAYKKAFFIDKKMTKSNPMSKKGIREIRGIKKPSDGMLHSKNRSGDGRFTGLNSELGLSDSEIISILKKELNEEFFSATKIGAIDYIKEVKPIGFRTDRTLALEVKGTLRKLYIEVSLASALVRVFNYSTKSNNPESGKVEAEVFYALDDINELLEEIYKMCLDSHSGRIFRSKPSF